MVRGGCWVATADTQTQEITPNLNASKMFVRSAAGFWSIQLQLYSPQQNKSYKVCAGASAGSRTLITEANCILVTNLKIVTKRTKSLLFGTFFAHNKEDIDRQIGNWCSSIQLALVPRDDVTMATEILPVLVTRSWCPLTCSFTLGAGCIDQLAGHIRGSRGLDTTMPTTRQCKEVMDMTHAGVSALYPWW